jgi:hypothetical protein
VEPHRQRRRTPLPSPHTQFATAHHEVLGRTSAGKAAHLRRLDVDVELHTVLGTYLAAATIEAALRHGRYEIRITGHLHARWADWFDGLRPINESDGTTIISGPVLDHAALHGSAPESTRRRPALVSVTSIDPNQPDVPTIAPR